MVRCVRQAGGPAEQRAGVCRVLGCGQRLAGCLLTAAAAATPAALAGAEGDLAACRWMGAGAVTMRVFGAWPRSRWESCQA